MREQVGLCILVHSVDGVGKEILQASNLADRVPHSFVVSRVVGWCLDDGSTKHDENVIWAVFFAVNELTRLEHGLLQWVNALDWLFDILIGEYVGQISHIDPVDWLGNHVDLGEGIVYFEDLGVNLLQELLGVSILNLAPFLHLLDLMILLDQQVVKSSSLLNNFADLWEAIKIVGELSKDIVAALNLQFRFLHDFSDVTFFYHVEHEPLSTLVGLFEIYQNVIRHRQVSED